MCSNYKMAKKTATAPAADTVKKTKVETKPKSETKETKPAKVVESVVSEPVVSDTVTNEVVDATPPQSFEKLLKQLTAVNALVNALKNDVKLLQKQTSKDMKVAQKCNPKRKTRDPDAKPKAPSGFVKPTLITDELAVFLEKPSGTEMARTAVTREINQYIRNNNLQDATNGRKILFDDKLGKLLKLDKGQELTYFNLQKYMSPHFKKQGAAATTTSN